MPRIVFICTGNVCRSPMAEYLLRSRLGEETEWQVESAGLLAGYGAPASMEAVKVLAEEEGMDLTPHRSRMFTSEIVEQADMLVCMTPAHKAEILRSHPQAEEKTFILTEFGVEPDYEGIPDPIGSSEEVYRRVKHRIEGALSDLIIYMRGE